MPRRNRPKRDRGGDDDEPLRLPREFVPAPPGWDARSSTKNATYICPGCNGRFDGVRPHVVAWPTNGAGGEKRHWHTPCYERWARTQRPR